MDNTTIGLTLFYILGALLVIVAALVVLIAKKES
jgi:hypothetical protein